MSKRLWLLGLFLLILFVPASNVHAATRVSGQISSDTEWTLSGSPYVVTGLLVRQGVTLTVDAGVVVKFDQTASLTVDGTLDVKGTEPQQVYFTSLKDDVVGGDTNGDGASTAPDGGDWGAIIFTANAKGHFNGATIRYGGDSMDDHVPSANVFNDGADLDFTNSHILHGRVIGLSQGSGTLTIESSEIAFQAQGINIYQGAVKISGSSFHDNSLALINRNTQPVDARDNWWGGKLGPTQDDGGHGTTDQQGVSANVNFAPWRLYDPLSSSNITTSASSPGVALGTRVSGIVNADVAWTKAGSPYIVDRLEVLQGAKLSIGPGTIVKLKRAATIKVEGTLDVRGSSTQPVYFTSFNDDSVGGDTNGPAAGPSPGDWNVIYVDGPSAVATFSHAVIRYGGGKPDAEAEAMGLADIQVQENGRLNLEYTEISHSSKIGIYFLSGVLTVSHGLISDQTDGLHIFSNGKATVINSDFHSIVGSGIVAEHGAKVDARNNWWGDPSGPQQATLNPQGKGVTVSEGVSFQPWLKAPPVSEQESSPKEEPALSWTLKVLGSRPVRIALLALFLVSLIGFLTALRAVNTQGKETAVFAMHVFKLSTLVFLVFAAAAFLIPSLLTDTVSVSYLTSRPQPTVPPSVSSATPPVSSDATATPPAVLEVSATGTTETPPSSGAVARESDLVDPPLYKRPPLVAAKVLGFVINLEDGQDAKPRSLRVSLDTRTWAYRIEDPLKGTSYVHVAGSYCFTKSGFRYTYCIREKYTSAALVYSALGIEIHPRKLTSDEQDLQQLMSGADVVPDDAIAGNTLVSELAIDLLEKGELKNGAKLEFQYDGKSQEIAFISDIQDLSLDTKLETSGIHLADVIAEAYNSSHEIPFLNFEEAKDDASFVQSLQSQGISFEGAGHLDQQADEKLFAVK